MHGVLFVAYAGLAADPARRAVPCRQWAVNYLADVFTRAALAQGGNTLP